MAASNSTSSTSTSAKPSTMPVLFGRGGYNGPAEEEEEERTLTLSARMNFGRGGYNRKGDDDDEAEDGRGGYN